MGAMGGVDGAEDVDVLLVNMVDGYEVVRGAVYADEVNMAGEYAVVFHGKYIG